MIDRRDVPVTGLTDAELFAVAAGGLPEPREDSKMLLLPPAQSTRQPSICFQKPRSRTPVARTGLRRIKIRNSQFDCASYRDHGVRLRSLVRNPGFFGGCLVERGRKVGRDYLTRRQTSGLSVNVWDPGYEVFSITRHLARPSGNVVACAIGYDHRTVEVPYVRAVGSERARQSVHATHAIGPPPECDPDGSGRDDNSIPMPCRLKCRDWVDDKLRGDVACDVFRTWAISLPCALNRCKFGAGKILRQDRQRMIRFVAAGFQHEDKAFKIWNICHGNILSFRVEAASGSKRTTMPSSLTISNRGLSLCGIDHAEYRRGKPCRKASARLCRK